jgi:hypothetical protein
MDLYRVEGWPAGPALVVIMVPVPVAHGPRGSAPITRISLSSYRRADPDWPPSRPHTPSAQALKYLCVREVGLALDWVRTRKGVRDDTARAAHPVFEDN